MDNLPTTATGTIRLLPINFGQLQLFKQKYVDEIAANGEAMEAAVQLKAMEELVDMLRKDKRLRELIMSQVDKYSEQKFEFMGVDIQKCELGTKYDYSKDRVWNELKALESGISLQRKDREELHKVLRVEMADPVTGEIIYPAIKTSESYIKVTIK